MWIRETENCLEKTELKIGFEEVETVITPHSYGGQGNEIVAGGERGSKGNL